MTDTYAKLNQRELTVVNTPGLLYDNTAPTQTIVKHIRVVNQSPSTDTAICMWLDTALPLVADVDTLILPNADISGGGWAEFEGTIILDPGDKLYAAKRNSSTATTASISISLYGLEMD